MNLPPLPQVSVVMSVFNGAGHLAETLDAILRQEDCDFEFIVVNDGSTDASATILNGYAAGDHRLRVIHQENTGLTRALIRGCSEAKGELIARQDAGDISLPRRLVRQASFLQQHPDAVMTGCAVNFLGPLGELLYEISIPMQELDDGLHQIQIEKLKGPPHHGATMFRREAYIKSGGYRATFVVAQDIDLWLRLSEMGLCLGMPDLLYHARSELSSISSRRREEQLRAAELALKCAEERKRGGNEHALLNAYSANVSSKTAISGFERARFHYFIASCLRTNDPMASQGYYLKAVRDNPLHLKAIFRLCQSLF